MPRERAVKESERLPVQSPCDIACDEVVRRDSELVGVRRGKLFPNLESSEIETLAVAITAQKIIESAQMMGESAHPALIRSFVLGAVQRPEQDLFGVLELTLLLKPPRLDYRRIPIELRRLGEQTYGHERSQQQQPFLNHTGLSIIFESSPLVQLNLTLLR
jgi:hypothetical protein